MKPTVPPEPRCELCGLKRSAPRHRNGDMQSFHRFEEPEAAAVPPEPAPPTLDPATFARTMAHRAQDRWLNGPGGHAEALDAVEATVVEVIEACAAAVADMRDVVDTAQWRRCVNTAVARVRALTGTPAPAPPTVAPVRPAREVAHEFVIATARCDLHAPNCPACVRWENAVTVLLLRDRASRSPGPAASLLKEWCDRERCPRQGAPSIEGTVMLCPSNDMCLWCRTREVVYQPGLRAGGLPSALRGEGPSPTRSAALPGSLHGACVDPACRAYWEHQVAAITVHNEHNAPVWAELDRLAQRTLEISGRIDTRSDSAGKEGRLRPGSEAAGKVQGAPLSGLDAATVEACANAVQSGKCFYDSRPTCQHFRCIVPRIRALATPPGQAKP